MPNKNLIDWTDLTGPTSGLDLLGNSIRDSLGTDAYQGKTRFVAIALTNMWPMSSQQSAGIDQASINTSTATQGNRRYAFKGRILGTDSPHLFLPNPCNPDFADPANNKQAWNIISMHTTFITANVENPPSIGKGDLVYVELEKSENAYNLQYGVALETAETQNKPPTAQVFCDTMNAIFDSANPSTMRNLPGGGPGGGSGPSSFAGPNGCNTKAQPSPSSDLPEDFGGAPSIQNNLDKTIGRSGRDKGNKNWFDGICLHYTVGYSFDRAWKALCRRSPSPLSYHFIIETNGTIHQLTALNRLAWHAPGVNGSSIGISLVDPGYAREGHPKGYKRSPGVKITDLYTGYNDPPWNKKLQADPNGGSKVYWPEPGTGLWYPDYSNAQIQGLFQLVRALKTTYPHITKIFNHSAVPKSGKQDAGASINWANHADNSTTWEGGYMKKLKDIIGDSTVPDYLGSGKTPGTAV